MKAFPHKLYWLNIMAIELSASSKKILDIHKKFFYSTGSSPGILLNGNA